MSDLVLKSLNEVYIKFECERSLAQELSEYFTFFVPGYQFTPQYKSRVWDGKIRLADLRTFTIYRGLLPYIEKFATERSYSLDIDDNLNVTDEFALKEAIEFIGSLSLPFEAREYQIKSFVHAIRNRRMLLLSPTASGKSLIIYLIIRYFQEIGLKRGLLIVPNISLVAQMYKDFESYGYDSLENCHTIHQGRDKQAKKFLFISTWQSIYTQSNEYFEQFDFVIGDEAHSFKAKSLATIMTGCINSKYRIGCTGTLDGTQTHRLVLEGLFGPVYQSTSTSELIEKKQLAEFKIKCLILKYPEPICKESKKWDYQTELDYIVSNSRRNDFIKNLVLSLEGNTLILFQLVERHGKKLFQLIQEHAKNRHVFFVFGGSDIEARESVRAITEKESNAIIVASYGVYSTGVNIRNLHNIIFASPSKSRIRNLQSIGRVLRLGENKQEATLFDIVCDFRSGKHANYTLKHFLERVKIYDSEKFNYKFYNIEFKP